VRLLPSLLAMALALAGCAHPSSTTYETGDVGRTIETTRGEVISSRIVQIAGDANAVGPLAGGAVGAAGSAIAFDKADNTGLIAIVGGLVGAGAGYLAQKQLSGREGIEYVLQMDDGRTVTLVQNRAADEVPLADGTPVLVQVSGQYTRVLPDPRPEGGGAAWVDPDAAPASGSGAAAAPPDRVQAAPGGQPNVGHQQQ
jgi:outer membrane lipoprotein SlyB